MMNNEKIGIGIVYCQSGSNSQYQGYNVVFSSDDQLKSVLDDTGDVFGYIRIKDNSTILRMIRLTETGRYLCSMKPAGSRDGEYRASWVYFPKNLKLSTSEIKNIVDTAESQIKEISFDENILKKEISKYNSTDDFDISYSIPQERSDYAFRDTSSKEYNIYDIINECMYQKEFAKYRRWVILMNKSDVELKGDIKDISQTKIYNSIGIEPISDTFGFTAYLKEHKFERPIRIPEGECLNVVYKRVGYVDINKEVKKQADLTISIKECYKIIPKTLFSVLNKDNNEPVRNYEIVSKGGKKRESDWIFPEEILEKVEFKVEAEGYNNKTFQVNLKSGNLNKELRFEMTPEKHEYHFIIPLDSSVVKDSKEVEFSINSQFEIKASPIKGFVCSNKPKEGEYRNKLSPQQASYSPPRTTVPNGEINRNPINPWNSGSGNGENPGQRTKSSNKLKLIKLAVYGLGILILLGVLIYGVCRFFGQGGEGDNEPQSKNGFELINSPNVSNSENSTDNSELILDYLKKNDKIAMDSLERYSSLQGLFDKMNKYNLKKVKEIIDNSELKDSILSIDNWKRIYEIADSSKSCSDKKSYLKKDDGEKTITLSKYINALENKAKTINGCGQSPNSQKGKPNSLAGGNKDQKANTNLGQPSKNN